jgi:hypothetical protein
LTSVAGRVDLDHVGGGVRVDREARLAGVAWAIAGIRVEAVDGLGQDAGCGGLARAARTAEQVGVSDAIEPYGVAQRVDDVILTEQLVRCERLWPILAIERE